MCPRRAKKKIIILSRSEYLVILTPHRYHRTSTTVSSPSVRGATPWRSVNPVAFDHGIYPFDFARTGFDQWTSPPGCVRSAHRNTLEQHPGQIHS